MDSLLTWVIENANDVGVVALVLIAFVTFLVALGKRWIIPKYYHDAMIEAGQAAIKTLEDLNPKLDELREFAAVQKVRDEFGKREMEAINARLRDCEHNLELCQDTRSRNRSRA